MDFDDAQKVIKSGTSVTFEDHRFDYGEQQLVTLGMLNEKIVVIITAKTEKEIRIICMRKAQKNEQKIYFDKL